jgi:branched-chain amino acid transport system substrate-binding protein
MGVSCVLALSLAACGSRVATSTIEADAGSAKTSGPAATGSGASSSVHGGRATSSPSGAGAGGGTAASGASGTVTSTTVTGTSSAGAPASGASGSAPATGASGASASGASGGAASGSPVVIGNIGTYSGIIGTIFSGVQQGLSVGIANLNAHGGLNGHPVKLVSEDDAGDPSTNQTEAQTMVQADGAIGFVSQFTPVSSSGSQGYLASKGIPVVGGDLYDPNWYSQSNWFPEGTNLLPGIADAFENIAAKVGKTQVAILYCIESSICSNIGTYLAAHPVAGAKVVYSAPISLTQPSFTAQCLDAKNAGANFMLVSADGASIERVAQNCEAQGITIELAEAAVAVNTSQASDTQVNGLVSALEDFPWFQDNTPATEAFHQAFQTYLPSFAPNENAAEAWTSVQLLQMAGAKLPASNPTAAELLAGADSLGSTTINGLSPSTITYHPGQAATGTNCYTFVEIVNGAWTAPGGDGPQCE